MAERHIRRGVDLAERNAVYSARHEFTEALWLVAQAHDAAEGGGRHAEALREALEALAEVDDFHSPALRGAGPEALGQRLASHRSRVYAAGSPPPATAVAAAQCYYEFARGRLVEAVGQEPIGSLALYSLGRLLAANATAGDATATQSDGHAMTLHQAALLADHRNFLAANELSVLLARYGRYAEARDLLRQAVAVSPRPSLWHNLAVVHARLGEAQLAEAARMQMSLVQQGGTPHSLAARFDVRWLEPQTFAGTSAPLVNDDATATPPAATGGGSWPGAGPAPAPSVNAGPASIAHPPAARPHERMVLRRGP